MLATISRAMAWSMKRLGFELHHHLKLWEHDALTTKIIESTEPVEFSERTPFTGFKVGRFKYISVNLKLSAYETLSKL